MLNRRHILGALAAMATRFPVPAVLAADLKSFDENAFEAAQAAGKPILVEVHAPWCPVCKKQTPILSQLSNEPKFKDMLRFSIDFDSQKDLLRKFNVQKQSTLIAFKGTKEMGRSVGDTDAGSIERLLNLTA